MRKFLLLIGLQLFSLGAFAQSFEVTGHQESYRALVGDVINVPVTVKNTSDRPLYLILKKTTSQLGSTQRSFLSVPSTSPEAALEEFSFKVEPGQTLSSVSIHVEAGLVAGYSHVRYILYNRYNPTDSHTLELNVLVEERPERTSLYSSPYITIYDVYPNPVTEDYAYIQYHITHERVKAHVTFHNVLGNPLSEYDFSPQETRLKIRTDGFTAGIYFYTLYVENEAVMTRKLIVKK